MGQNMILLWKFVRTRQFYSLAPNSLDRAERFERFLTQHSENTASNLVNWSILGNIYSKLFDKQVEKKIIRALTENIIQNSKEHAKAQC